MYLFDQDPRRAALRKKDPNNWACCWAEWRNEGVIASVIIAIVFWALMSSIILFRQEVPPYRPGQIVQHDVLARVEFAIHDKDRYNQAQESARQKAPRVYTSNGEVFDALQELLLSLPDKVAGDNLAQLPRKLAEVIDTGTQTLLHERQAASRRPAYEKQIRAYIEALKNAKLIILPEDKRDEDIRAQRYVSINGASILPGNTYASPAQDDLSIKLSKLIEDNIELALQSKVLIITTTMLPPTHVLNDQATVEAQNRAADEVPRSAGEVRYKPNSVLVAKGTMIDQRNWTMLRAEHLAFVASLGSANFTSKLGLAGIAALLTLILSLYVAVFQPRVVKNHARAIAIVALLGSTFMIAQMSAVSSFPIYFVGIAPTILVAMILTIAYDNRFTFGVAGVHAIFVTIGLAQTFGFFLVMFTGIATVCFMMSDIRTRSRLIEIGFYAAAVMMLATWTTGLVAMDPWAGYSMVNGLYAALAGLAVGFFVLGTLPFIEKAFRITTSMTLLELADASQPLLRRLALEATGTYNHSLQVATLSEAAAEAIGANSLLCRVASYYHDIGKISKSDYFVENQAGGENRHINLSPHLSLRIIINHVKDGVELGKEYHLPTSFLQFIQQHHGTTLVEYFYFQAMTANRPEGEPPVSEDQFRYPGPKPRTREIAVVMMADAVESACRAMPEPTAARIEALVEEIARKRLEDGQFDECDLTTKDLADIKSALSRTLQGIYHGRLAYPSTQAIQEQRSNSAGQVKTA